MKLIKPYYEIIEQQPGEIGMLKHIEAQGRVAWKSEDRITDDSYLKFVEMLKGVNHGSVLEHGTVYLSVPFIQNDKISNSNAYECWSRYSENKYSCPSTQITYSPFSFLSNIPYISVIICFLPTLKTSVFFAIFIIPF